MPGKVKGKNQYYVIYFAYVLNMFVYNSKNPSGS